MGITPGAGFVNTGAAIVIGIVVCICSNILGEHMKENSSIGAAQRYDQRTLP